MNPEGPAGPEGGGRRPRLAGTSLTALQDTMPLAVSAMIYGSVFGLMAREVGLTTFEAMLMSALVFAGAAQFAALSLWRAGAPPVPIVFTALVVNLRYLLLGASMARELYPRRLGRPALAALAGMLSDESYVVSTRHFAAHGPSGGYLLAANSLLYVAWLASSFVGAQFGSTISDPKRYAVDFAFPAAFVALLAPQLKERPRLIAAATAAAVALAGTRWMSAPWRLFAAMLAGAAAGAVVDRRA